MKSKQILQNMRTSKIILTAVVGLIMTAMADAANKITGLPYTITAPGTYELTSNLTSLVAGNAITINVPVAGTVVLNLNKFAILWNPNVGAGEFTDGVAVLDTTSPKCVITIKNGTIGGLDQGFWIGISVNQSPPNVPDNVYLTNVTINNVTFTGERVIDLNLNQVNAATVSNCTFIGLLPQTAVQYGIADSGSQGGNKYVNNSFDGGQNTALAISPAGPSVITRAEVAPPAN